MAPPPTGDDAMRTLAPQPTIVEQACHAILDAICEGRLEPGERLTQESVAARLAVSRQPVGQALLLLKQQKFLVEAGRRGLRVAPLDRDFMRGIHELRLAIDPLAASVHAARPSWKRASVHWKRAGCPKWCVRTWPSTCCSTTPPAIGCSRT